MTKKEAVEKLLRLAGQQVGYCADQNKCNKYAKYFDSEYPGFYNSKKNCFDWCDIFVDWLFVQSFGMDKGRRMLYQPEKSCGAGCSWSAFYYRSGNALYQSPEVGDQIFFCEGADIYHTGIVEKIENNRVYTIEGNTGYKPLGKVQRFNYNISNPAIYGYGRPDWSLVVDKPRIDDAKLNRVVERVRQYAEGVILGNYGVNPRRRELLGEYYDAVQFIVNKYYKE